MDGDSDTSRDDARVTLSLHSESLSRAEVERVFGASARDRLGNETRSWMVELGSQPGKEGSLVTLNDALARVEEFLESNAERLDAMRDQVRVHVMISWRIHCDLASPVTMTPGLIAALNRTGATVWLDGNTQGS